MYQLYSLFYHEEPLIHCFNSTSSCALNIYPTACYFFSPQDYFCLCIFPRKLSLIYLILTI